MEIDVSSPFVAASPMDNSGDNKRIIDKEKCWGCNRIIQTTHECAKCHFVKYCSRSCKKNNSKNHERSECKIYSEIKPKLRQLSFFIANIKNLIYLTENSSESSQNINSICFLFLNHFNNLASLVKEMDQLPVPGIGLKKPWEIIFLPDSTEKLVKRFSKTQKTALEDIENNLLDKDEALKTILKTAQDIANDFQHYSRELSSRINKASPIRMRKLDFSVSRANFEGEFDHIEYEIGKQVMDLQKKGAIDLQAIMINFARCMQYLN